MACSKHCLQNINRMILFRLKQFILFYQLLLWLANWWNTSDNSNLSFLMFANAEFYVVLNVYYSDPADMENINHSTYDNLNPRGWYMK